MLCTLLSKKNCVEHNIFLNFKTICIFQDSKKCVSINWFFKWSEMKVFLPPSTIKQSWKCFFSKRKKAAAFSSLKTYFKDTYRQCKILNLLLADLYDIYSTILRECLWNKINIIKNFKIISNFFAITTAPFAFHHGRTRFIATAFDLVWPWFHTPLRHV